MTYDIIRPDKKSEGAGAVVKRVFPSSSIDHLDPFVLLDEFFVDPDAGFPMHRHAGFEALTYILQGSFTHKDTLGNDSTVGEGGVQKFTAGKGIEHSEMPGGDKKTHGFQLWINLPEDKKDVEPSYQKIEAERIPETVEERTRKKTIVGEDSPVNLETPMLYRDVSLARESQISLQFLEGYTGFLYVYEGEIIIEKSQRDLDEDVIVSKGEAYFPHGEKRFSVKCETDSSFISISGEPIGEEIELRGSVVR